MIPKFQTAVQLVGPDELILNTQKPVHQPGPHQILALVEAVGLCFSDMKLLHAFTGHPRKGPIVSGIDPEILKDIPVYSHHVRAELTTPTGAAIIKELSSGHGGIPTMNIEKIGIGAGSRDFRDWPNVLRIFTGAAHSLLLAGYRTAVPEEMITVIETNIDDMNPQIFEHIMDMLFQAGSLDAYLTQVIMKKGRPAVKLTVLCDTKRRETIAKIILGETSSIGLRYYEAGRCVMQREIKTIHTKLGKIRYKFAKLGNEIMKSSPEYEDCRKIARRLNIPLIEVMKKIQQTESP